MRYRKKRDYSWSHPIAYAVGLIASDGCLQSDGRHIELTSIDIEQLENFSTAIGRELPISNKLNGNNQPAYRIQFSDVSLYDFLVDCGLTPAKSLTLKALSTPDEYFSSFFRGVFDGDGTTYGYNDPRWPTSFLFYIAISGASRPFLQYLCFINKRLFGTTGQSITKGVRAYRLQYAKQDASKLYDAMYGNAKGLFLKRKQIKLEGFINRDKSDTILQSLGASGVIR